MDALERFRQLAAWLADTDITQLELRGPQTLLRLARDGSVGGDVVEAEAEAQQHAPANASPPCPATTTVVAPSVGILRYRHPLRDVPLAAIGARIESGQPLALLQIGQMLLAVPAPHDGAVVRLLAGDGAVVGYGDALVEFDGLMGRRANEADGADGPDRPTDRLTD